ncbi:MAG TPA: 50S ribosomal protein L32 [Thermodesulfobacteriota bacterium]|nr:50S ribosomal protein L32 [Thermodesulfobacteriota bacterium]
MPNPKKRHSKTRRNKRRSHDALSSPAISLCPQCGESKRPHHICQKCGTYKGREIIKIGESV